jgi:hypothetical protein
MQKSNLAISPSIRFKWLLIAKWLTLVAKSIRGLGYTSPKLQEPSYGVAITNWLTQCLCHFSLLWPSFHQQSLSIGVLFTEFEPLMNCNCYKFIGIMHWSQIEHEQLDEAIDGWQTWWVVSYYHLSPLLMMFGVLQASTMSQIQLIIGSRPLR